MMKSIQAIHIAVFLALAAILSGCAVKEEVTPSETGAQIIPGIQARILGEEPTRAGTVTPLADYVGRSTFKSGDRVVFTLIKRTSDPIANFTYTGTGSYDGIIFDAGSEGGWVRNAQDGGPERIYWTDASSAHTFVAYGCPQDAGYDWKSYAVSSGRYYMGSLGNPANADTLNFYLTPAEQATNKATVNNKEVYYNPALEKEDLVIAYDTGMKAEPGGSVALVTFRHALSSIRVVVNISGFSSSSSAEDNKAVVSDMVLLHQPTLYKWMQENAGAQPVTSQDEVNSAWGDGAPAYDQRKPVKLWIPHPEGAGSNQNKTFTFYGITTPQPESYIETLAADHAGRTLELTFKVTYPNPLNPSQNVKRTYTASLQNVYFEAGYNTTVNISLNHRNEQMTVGAEYENWQYVATPDVSELMKNSTFLQDVERESVTIVGDEKATKDDATWLYELSGTVYDIYGHNGNTPETAYQISTAYQLLSFAYEVNAGRTFEGQYIRLDADLTLQTAADAETLSWIGIGDSTHPFQGTFLGGNRYLYRLKGAPLFANVGANGHVQELQVSSLSVTGSGLLAETNAGRVSACIAVGDVTLDGSTAGALVGSNAGTVYACYHIGETKGEETATVGGLVGTNSGTIAHCFQSGNVSGSTKGGITGANTGTLTTNFYNRSLLTPTIDMEGVKGKTTAEMTLPAFVMALNAGIAGWSYVFRPANYPVLGTYVMPNGWLETDLEQLVAGDVFVIVGNNGSDYAMANDKGTAAATAVSVSVEDGVITSHVPSNLLWNLTVDGGNYTFYPDQVTNKWMYCVNSDNYVKVGGNSDNKSFILAGNGYLQNVTTGKYVGIYRSQDWRAYPTVNNYIKNQKIKFYKYYDDGRNADVTLSYPDPVTYSPDATYNATVSNPHGVGLSYSSSQSSVATVDEATGQVTIKGAGVTTIRAAWEATADYRADYFDFVLTVEKATPVIAAFDNPTTSVAIDGTVTNTTTISPAGLAITYTTSDDRVATVDASTGEVTGIADGTAVISATFTGNDNYSEAVPQTYIITVGTGTGDTQTYTMTLDANANTGTKDVHVLESTESFTWNTITWIPSVTWADSENTSWGATNNTTVLQIGSGPKPATSFSLTTAGFGGKTLVSVSVDCYYTAYTGSSNKPTLTITAGGTTILPATAMTKTTATTMTSTNTEDITMGASDNLVIQFNSSVAAGLCISKIMVVYK